MVYWSLFIFLFFLQGRMIECSTILGVKTSDSVLLSSTCDFAPGNTMMRSDYDWIEYINDNTLIGLHGDSADCQTLLENLKAADRDYRLNTADIFEIDIDINYSLENNEKYKKLLNIPPASLAYYCRKIIADMLRKRPLNVNCIIGGWDHDKCKPCLFVIDRLASIREVPFAVHGQEFLTVLTLMDAAFGARTGAMNELLPLKELINNDRGKQVLMSCWEVIRKRTTSGAAHKPVVIKGVNEKGILDLGSF